MNLTLLRETISRLVSLHPDDDFGIEKCWNEMSEMLSKDISATISYFETDCTDEEFYWLASVFEDVVERTQSKELLQALNNRLARVIPETYCQQNFNTEHMRKYVDYTEYIRSVTADIEFAKGKLND